MGRLGKGMTTYMDLRTKSPNKKQKLWTVITGITDQYFRELLKDFKNSPYLYYKK